MAPQKSLPPAKVSLVLSFFRTTAVAHSLKDLEKSLPAAASISSMAVKDYLAYLSGECLLNVEKIGSGNWYWSFPADAKRQKENLLNDAKKERDKLNAQVEGLKKVQEEAIRVKEEEGIDEEEKERDKVRVKEAGERLVELGRRKEELVRQLEGMEGEVVAEGEVKSWADKHNLLVDNIFSLMAFINETSGGDREKMAAIRQAFGIEEDMDYIEV